MSPKQKGKMALVHNYSWLDTSPWSLRVMPSPMADFMRRESDGSTLIGGEI
jgi:hypothetical protein